MIDPKIRKRLARTALLSLFALFIGAGMGLFHVKNQSGVVVENKTESKAIPGGASIGGPFSLINQDGQRVTQETYAGKYKLIYFGFTYCPAICPTELQKISKVMKDLGRDADRMQPLFITIDPERDTAQVMREYVKLFDPRLQGLTGSRAEIDATLKAYRVFASKVQMPDSNDYTMDHSSFIYLMSPDDTLISIYRIEDGADYIVKDIRKKIKDA